MKKTGSACYAHSSTCLNGSIDMGITYSPQSLDLVYWIDASYNLHPDSCGHTGIGLTLGRDNAPIYTKSQKQKLTTHEILHRSRTGGD